MIILDRIEGTTAVLETEDGMENVPRQLLPAEFSGWAACSPHDGVAHATTAHRTFRRMERTRTGGFRFPPEQTDAGGRCSVYIVDQTGTMQFAEVRLPAPPPPTLPLSETNQSTEPSVS